MGPNHHDTTLDDLPETDRPEPLVTPSWKPLKRTEYILLFAMLLSVSVAAVTKLNPGICFDDPGDLQLASTLLGIMHPPGYAGYASAGYLITRLPGIDPAYVITLACLVAGLVMLWFCFAFQIRLGVNPWIATIVCFIFTAHRRTWANLIVPEVYALSLMLLAAAAYMMLKYHHLGRRRDFFMSALLYGFVLANRPPVLFALPFFIIAWWMARKRWESAFRKYAITFLIGTMLIATPLLYSFTYYWFRDTPATLYNYIQRHNRYFQVLPDSQKGSHAKIERIRWLVTAKQFSSNYGTNWHDLRSKFRWLKYDLLAARPGALSVFIIITIIGAMVAYQRNTVAFWLITGMGLSSLVFVCVYRIHGLAADTLPLLFSMAIFSGIACSRVMSFATKPYQIFLLITLASTFGYCVLRDAPPHQNSAKSVDAIPFLQEVDLKTFPPNALICTDWRSAIPLWYAQHVLTPRPDLQIIAGTVSAWIYFIQKYPDKPAYVTGTPSILNRHDVTPFRNMWQVTLNPSVKD